MKNGKTEGKKSVNNGVIGGKVNSNSMGKSVGKKMEYASKPTMTSKGPYAPT